MEAVSSQGLATDFGGQHYFMNNQYLDSKPTNKGIPPGQCHRTRRSRHRRPLGILVLQPHPRRSRLSPEQDQPRHTCPTVETITDGFVNGSYAINRHWTAQIFTQYERFLIPSYMNGSQHNTSGWFQLTWNPS